MIRTFYGYNGSDRFGRAPIAKNLQTDIASEPKFEMDRIFNIIPPKVNTIIKYLYLAHGVDKVLADIYLVYAMSLASERSFCIRFMRTFSHSRGHFKSILPFLFFLSPLLSSLSVALISSTCSPRLPCLLSLL